MDRREFLKTSATTGAALALTGRSLPARAGAKRPNVLLMMCDQMRQPRWFPDRAHLPNFERLASGGLEFTRHFVSAVPCSPSRACLFTGLHMDQNGVHVNMHKEFQQSLDPNIPTLGHLFRSAGYRTPYFGKWHLASNRDVKAHGLEPYGFEMISLQNPGEDFLGVNNDKEFTDAALKWLSEPANQRDPWFLVLSLINPHDICGFPGLADVPGILVPFVTDEVPPNWKDDLSGKPRCQREFQETYNIKAGKMSLTDQKIWRRYLDYYFYLNRLIDDQIGRVMKKLENLGLAENTLVIFTSDHGDMG